MLALLALVTTATSGGAQEGRRVVFERFGYRLSRVGETVAAKVGVLDAAMFPEPNPAVTWRTDSPAIATVSARGVVQARGTGYTRLWAISGRDSAFVLVVVTGNTIQFAPSPVRFEGAGGRLALRARLVDPAGRTLEDLSRTRGLCHSMDEGIATLGADGQVLSRGTGVTYVRCGNRGVTDSVRIEVGQRPVKLEIANGVRPLAVGDTLRLVARADNSTGERITASSPSWVSTNPRVVYVDSASGFARALMQGTTMVIARLGGMSDSLRLTVQPPASVASLRLDPIAPFVDDTVKVNATARNAAGGIVAYPDPPLALVLRSSRPDVVAIIGDQRIVALRPGSAWVVATSGTLADSVQVAPRDRAPAVVVQGAADADAEQRARQALDSARAAEVRSTIRIGGMVVTLTATGAQTTHTSTLALGLNESRSGLLLGGAATVAPSRHLDIAGDFRTGTLTGSNAIGGDIAMTEVVGQLTYWPLHWLGLRGGYTRRSESTDLVLHHWQFANATAVTRYTFAGGALNAVSAISLLPWGGFSGHVDGNGRSVAPNRTSVAAEAGLEYEASRFSAAISYYGENFTFPEVNGTARQDRFSSLRLRIGVQGWPLRGTARGIEPR